MPKILVTLAILISPAVGSWGIPHLNPLPSASGLRPAILGRSVQWFVTPTCASAQDRREPRFQLAQQESVGPLDLTGTAREQIAYIEASLEASGDLAAERQAVMLLWLVDLYQVVGDFGGVEYSYTRILAYFPYDVGVLNSYGLFLLDVRRQNQRAESLLVEASRWGRYTDARSLDRGETYRLLALVETEKGDFDSAIRHAAMAVELMDDESSADARRALAEAYRRGGQYDAAARVYIDVIALERGANTEDINALKLFVGKCDSIRVEEVNDLVARAISDRDAERRRFAAAEGAELVSIETADGVVLEGTLRRRDGAGAVLFVPDIGATRSVYKPYAQLLGIDGVSSLSLDLRGQGGSRSDSLLSQASMPLGHSQRLPDDVAAGFGYLQKELDLDPEDIVIVSEGYACAVVEKALVQGHLTAPVAHLSPSFSRHDRDLTNAISFRPDLPILLYYSSEDLDALRSSSYFGKSFEHSHLTLTPFHDSGRGVDILRRNPNALEAFQAWIRATVSTP